MLRSSSDHHWDNDEVRRGKAANVDNVHITIYSEGCCKLDVM